MKTWTVPLLSLAIFGMTIHAARAQYSGAITSGDWNDPSIWTSGSAPDATSDLFVGSDYPPSSASTATVSLTQNEAVNALFLGSNSGNSGTVIIGSNHLTIAAALNIGAGIGALSEAAGGSFTTSTIAVRGSHPFTFGANDQATNLTAFSGGTVTTTSTENLSGKASVSGGSTLNLGAPLSLADPQGLDVSDNGSAVNMNGFPIVASKMFLGYDNTYPVTLNRGGPGGTLTVSDLYVGNAAYDVPPTDNVQDLYLSNGTSTLQKDLSFLALNSGSVGTTTSNGNITHSAFVSTGSTLNLGTDLNLSTEIDVSGVAAC